MGSVKMRRKGLKERALVTAEGTRASLKARTEAQLKRAAFLSAYAQLGNLSAAAKIAGTERRKHYVWLKDKRYKAAFADAEEQATERMEQEGWRRAVVGTDKPIYHKGQKIDTLKEFSDVLLIFLLKARRPDKYRERYEYSGPGGVAPFQVTIYLPENQRQGAT